MEKRATLGFGGVDFSGHCPSCPTACEPEIRSLLTKFSQGGIVIEDASSWNALGLTLKLPNQVAVSFGHWCLLTNTQHPHTIGQPTDWYCAKIPNDGFYPAFTQIGGAGSGDVWSKVRDVYTVDNRLSASTRFLYGDHGVRCPSVGRHPTIPGGVGPTMNDGQEVHKAMDVFTTVDNYSFFPICGSLQVTDSGSYYNFNRQDADNELLFILVKDVPQGNISEKSDHPHLLSTTNIKFGENRGRFWRNHEQIKQLGVSRITSTMRIGTIVEERYCKTPAPGWYGVGGHAPVQDEGPRYYIYPKYSTDPYYPTYNDALDVLVKEWANYNPQTGGIDEGMGFNQNIPFPPYIIANNEEDFGGNPNPKSGGAGINIFGKYNSQVWREEWQGGPPGGGYTWGTSKWLRYIPMFYYQPSSSGFPHLPSDLYFGTEDVDLNGFVLSETVGTKSFDLSSVSHDGYSSPPYHAVDSGPIEAVTYYEAGLDAGKTSLNYPLNFQQVYQKQFSGNIYLPTSILDHASGLPGPVTLSDEGTPIFRGGSISGLSFTASLK